MNGSSELDERTMREIYLPAFEQVVKEAKPWTVMASYNKIGGIFSTENKKYLTDLLRKEWGYQGAVVSDWGATHDRAAAVGAGTDLTMPAAIDTDKEIAEAVRAGKLKEEELDAACIRILELVEKAVDSRQENLVMDYEAGHKAARQTAEESVILLKNEGNLLPLEKGKNLAFIGVFAKEPRYQGGGSSHVNSYRVKGALEMAKEMGETRISYVPGYSLEHLEADEDLIAEAVAAAKEAEAVVIFAGLPEILESEGYDRAHMQMPEGQNALIKAVCEVQPNTVVVLHNGAPVETPWADMPAAVLETYLGGEAIGEAVADILFGNVNPSGRLPESFPVQLQDTPSYLNFQGEDGSVYYGERMFVGYRYYESCQRAVRWPFGYGLSYTDFSYRNLSLDREKMSDEEELRVDVDVTNIGKRTGKTVVQLYVAPPQKEGMRPVRELRAFEKVELQPGETKTVTFSLGKRSFAYWRTAIHDWFVTEGDYLVQIGTSSHDIVLEKQVHVSPTKAAQAGELTLTSTLGDFISHPIGAKFWEENRMKMFEGVAKMGLVPAELLASVNNSKEENKKSESPLGGMGLLFGQPLNILSLFIEELSESELLELLNRINAERR